MISKATFQLTNEKRLKKNVDKLYVNHQAHMKLYQLHTVKKNKIEKFVTFSITL